MIVAVFKRIRRYVVLTAGYTVLGVGVALLVLPGPAFIVIPIGLAILATEVQWARRLLDRLKPAFDAARRAAKARKERKARRP